MKWLFSIFLLWTSLSGVTQEICDNGIDDDLDGLVDLQDDDCFCGVGLNSKLNNAIHNPDFNSSSCCPTTPNTSAWFYNLLNCVDGWVTDSTSYGFTWAINYLNSCNSCSNWLGGTFIPPPECTSSSGNGFLSISFFNWNGWYYDSNNSQSWYSREASSCLNTPLYPGHSYELNFDAFNAGNFQYANNFTDTIYLSLYGTKSCANVPPPQTSVCSDPNWDVLDSIGFKIPTDTAWYQHGFTFSPSDTIYGIALGQSCENNFSGTNNGWDNWQQILFDNLTLYSSEDFNIRIMESGNVCSPPYILTSAIDTTGGTWQWYKDSVAIIGETDSVIDITNMGPGNYTVLYSMNNTCQGLNLNVPPPVNPLAFQTAVASPICEGDNVSFDGFSFVSAGTIDHFYYDFGNGDSAFVEDPDYVYDTAGVFNVIFTVETNLACTTSVSQIVTVSPKPEVDFLTGNQCLYDAANFVSLSTIDDGVLDSLSWDFDDGNIEHDSLESHVYNMAGNYNVELFARSDQGCIDSIIKTISIHPVPKADYVVDEDCENINISFTNSSSITSGNIINYEWIFGDNATSNTVNANHTYLSPDIVTTSLIVTSDSGCVDTSSIILEIYPEPVAHFIVNSSCFFAKFENTSTIANNGNIVTTNWNFGDGNTDTEYDTEHFYTANGDYNVTLEVISNHGCINQFDSTINIFNNFDASFTILNHLICSNEPMQFTNTSTEVFGQEINYLWEASDGQTSTLEHPVFNFVNNTELPTPIEMSLKISTSSGCIDSAFQTPVLSIIPTPNADFYFTPSEPTISNPEVQFTNLSVRADSYDWNFGNDSYSTELNPTHTYPEYTKSYSVTLTAYNNSDKICSDEERKIITIQDEILFFIPNTFTPDGSGINDQFTPHFISGLDIYNFRLQIFNRWGEIVFESRDPAVGWDGNYAGDVIKGDVYLWKIDFEDSMLDKVHTHTGTVTVLR